MTIVFPSSYYKESEVDRDYREEYQAAKQAGFSVVLYSYEDLINTETVKLFSEDISADSTVLYRGWMLKPIDYKKLYDSCKENNFLLLTSPSQYKTFHYFPNIYPMIQEDTAPTMIFKPGEKIPVSDVGKKLGRFLVKDYVKSAKNTDFPTYFEPTISQDSFEKEMEKFYKYRGNLLSGGILCKKFETLRTYQGKTNEYRVFYSYNTIFSISPNSNQPSYSFLPKPPMELIEKYSGFNSPLYTIDYAEKENGSFFIIEAGDGGVSGLSPGQDTTQFYRHLFYLFRRENENF